MTAAVTGGLLLLAVVLIVTLIGVYGSRSPATKDTRVHATAAPRRAQESSTRGRGTARTRTFLGPNGVESTAVTAENRRPGTTAWQISDEGVSGNIEGFADENYAAVGDEVDLYVSTTAPRFQVVAYRMGWYGGTGGRQVWSSPEVTGQVQPPCPLTPGVNMVSCDDWARSLVVPITTAFVPGDYVLKLIGSGGQQSYVPITIWDPKSHATYLIMARSFTEAGLEYLRGILLLSRGRTVPGWFRKLPRVQPSPSGVVRQAICGRQR